MQIPIGVSNRHVHLTKEVMLELFGSLGTPEHYVNQQGEYASNFTVTLKGPKGIISGVRVMGPPRAYNQVELSKSDAYSLGVSPSVARSGDLLGACDITLSTKKEVFLPKAGILAETHVHMNGEDAKRLGVHDKDIVNIKINTERPGVLQAVVKVLDNGYLECHIDRDQANAFLLENGDLVELELD